jgi:outer membrane protein assembly factor BamB
MRQSKVFAATTAGAVFAVVTADGDVSWQRFFSKPLRSGVTVLDSRLFVASDDSLYLLGVETGSVAHAVRARGPVIQPPAVAGDVLVLVSPEAFIAAYDANTLEERWWHPVGDAVFGGVAIARDTAFVATVNGELWRVPVGNPDGAVVQSLDRAMRMTPVPVRNGVLLGAVGGEVLFLRDGSDEPAWSRMVDGPLEFPPIVDNGMVFVYDGRGTIHAWRTPAGDEETAEGGGV